MCCLTRLVYSVRPDVRFKRAYAAQDDLNYCADASGQFPAPEMKGQDFVGLPLERARHDRDVYRRQSFASGS